MKPGAPARFSPTAAGQTWAVITALSYTATNLFLRAASVSIDPWAGSLLRQVPVFVVAWGAVVLMRSGEVWPASPRFLGWRFALALVGAGVVSFVIGNFFYFDALGAGGLGITASSAQAASMLVALVAGLLLLGERPTIFTWVGAAVLMGGLALIGLARGSASDTWLLALAFACGAGASYAVANVLTRTVQRSRPTTFPGLAFGGLGGLVPLLAIQLVRNAGNPLAGADGADILIVLVAGCFNAVALVGIFQALRHVTVAIQSSLQSATIVFSFLGAVIIFAEPAEPMMVAGVLAVSVGIVVAQVRTRRAAVVTPQPPPMAS
jgi:drug/metabolite transporter (DMT)-like permease